MAKDLFSDQAAAYSLYRPVYPEALFQYILSFVDQKDIAWDCATGSGQSAITLSNYFQKVYASDISRKQLEQAPRNENIEYVVCPAELTPFEENTFDLITVSQAYHWLDWKKFHAEAMRVAKQGCVIAIWMYDLIQSKEQGLNDFIRHFYKEITGPYWDVERQYIDNRYTSVAFDFDLLPAKEFLMETHFNREQLLGYFSTWSATLNFIKANGYSPLEGAKEELVKLWPGSENKPFFFPLVLKLGRINK